jgi:hypothetical protein
LFKDDTARSASSRKLSSAVQMAQLHSFRQSLLDSPRYADAKRLLKFGYRVFSQADEDGILHEIFRRIGAPCRSFIEIGSSDGMENNSRFLLTQGWRGAWIEASSRKVAAAKKSAANFIESNALCIEQHLVNLRNVDALLASVSSAREIDMLSIDIDGNDLYVLQAVQSISPRVIVCEYNAKFPADTVWVMEYNENHVWDGTDYFGASLKAFEKLLGGKGYSLVGCNLLGCNAFFVRTDLLSASAFCSPYTAENHYEPARYFLLPAYHDGFPPRLGPFRTEI